MKTPFHSTVQLDGLTVWLLSAPTDQVERFNRRVDQIIVEKGWALSTAQRTAYREWTEGNL